MRARPKRSRGTLSRREILFAGGIAVAAFATQSPAQPASASVGPKVYTRIGVQPFINCTDTCPINVGSAMLAEVTATTERASHSHVNPDELMEEMGGTPVTVNDGMTSGTFDLSDYGKGRRRARRPA